MKNRIFNIQDTFLKLVMALMSLCVVATVSADTDDNDRTSDGQTVSGRANRHERVTREERQPDQARHAGQPPAGLVGDRRDNRRNDAGQPPARPVEDRRDNRRNFAGQPPARLIDDRRDNRPNGTERYRRDWRDAYRPGPWYNRYYYRPPLRRHWVNWYIPLTFGGVRYFYSNGGYYRFDGFGFSLLDGDIGVYVTTLPYGYRTVIFNDYPYYYANNRYYILDPVRNAYLQVDDPHETGNTADNSAGTSAYQELFVYPTKGQTQEQLGQDKYECHLWAVNQSGFDPSLGQPGAFAEYRRAQCACLEGRGYTVK